MNSSPVPSVTSHAILGLLALRPWTAYELTQQLGRSLRYCWPKAESVLYDEPKRLVRLGLATVREEPAGRRTRAVYEITDEGRRAHAAWLATEPAPPRFEFETKEDALGAIRAARHWAASRAAEGLDQLRGYLADGGPFPRRLHISVLFARFYGDLFELIIRWADLAEEHIEQWPRTDGLGMTGPTRELLDELVTRMEALTAAESARNGASGHGGPS